MYIYIYIYICKIIRLLHFVLKKLQGFKADGKLISAEEQRQNVVQGFDLELLNMLTGDSQLALTAIKAKERRGRVHSTASFSERSGLQIWGRLSSLRFFGNFLSPLR